MDQPFMSIFQTEVYSDETTPNQTVMITQELPSRKIQHLKAMLANMTLPHDFTQMLRDENLRRSMASIFMSGKADTGNTKDLIANIKIRDSYRHSKDW